MDSSNGWSIQFNQLLAVQEAEERKIIDLSLSLFIWLARAAFQKQLESHTWWRCWNTLLCVLLMSFKINSILKQKAYATQFSIENPIRDIHGFVYWKTCFLGLPGLLGTRPSSCSLPAWRGAELRAIFQLSRLGSGRQQKWQEKFLGICVGRTPQSRC